MSWWAMLIIALMIFVGAFVAGMLTAINAAVKGLLNDPPGPVRNAAQAEEYADQRHAERLVEGLPAEDVRAQIMLLEDSDRTDLLLTIISRMPEDEMIRLTAMTR